MNEAAFLPSLIGAVTGAFETFFVLLDGPFLIAIMVAVFLSNLVMPAVQDMPPALKWVSMHRYRVPLIAVLMAIMFALFRDYDGYGRSMVFCYFLTLMFSMCLNLWVLDKPADRLVANYPWLKTLLKGRDPVSR